MLKTLIIDDQEDAIEDLQYLIKKNKLPAEVIATANSGAEGLAAILKHKPQLVFLDVVMPGMSGFEMLALVPQINFHLIVTTSMDQYAVQAIRASALDFLLKPIKLTELKEAIERSVSMSGVPSKSQINLLENNLKEKNQPIKKIALPISEGVELFQLEDILYFESDGNYTTVHLTDKRTILVSKQIGKFEEIVEKADFFRVHNSYLVNLNHIKKYLRNDGGYIVLSNGKSITVARNRKDGLLELLSGI